MKKLIFLVITISVLFFMNAKVFGNSSVIDLPFKPPSNANLAADPNAEQQFPPLGDSGDEIRARRLTVQAVANKIGADSVTPCPLCNPNKILDTTGIGANGKSIDSNGNEIDTGQ